MRGELVINAVYGLPYSYNAFVFPKVGCLCTSCYHGFRDY